MIIGCDICDWKSKDGLIEETIQMAENHVKTAHAPQPYESFKEFNRLMSQEPENLKLGGCKE